MSPKPTVMKFGGTSVGDAQAFAKVARIITERRSCHPVVIVSAMSGMTDALSASLVEAAQGRIDVALTSLDLHFQRHTDVARSLLGKESTARLLFEIENARSEIRQLLASIAGSPHPQATLRDGVLSYGEQLSSSLLAANLRERGTEASAVDPRRCIVTNGDHGCATPLLPETFRATRITLEPLTTSSVVPVIGGFIGATTTGETTTLGRGGSDYTASLMGAALSAQEIQIWTDVTGVLTADPRVVPNALTIPRLSYAEAAELAYFGAKVLHPKTTQPAIEDLIPLRICNSQAPEEGGTLVCAEVETSPRAVKAIAHKTGITTVQITSARMLGAYGFLRALFEVFDRHRTAVDVVTTSEVSVSLSLDDARELPAIVDELKILGTVNVEKNRAIICVVGEGLRGTPGVAAEIFSTINDINVTLISQGASSINLTFAIEEGRAAEAVARLHRAFFEESSVQRPMAKIVHTKEASAFA